MAGKISFGLLVCGTAIAMAAPAWAQTQGQGNVSGLQAVAQPSMFARDRNISVAERPHPGYDAVPVRMGSFIALPKLDAGVEFNDNIYAAATSKSTDTIITVNPEIDLYSNWNRNALQAFVRSATRDYTKFGTETTTDYQLGGSGRLDVGSRGNLTAGGDTGELTEPRTSTNTSHVSTHPIRYQQSDGYIGGAQEVNRIRLSGRIDFQNLDYHNGVDASGVSVLEDDRDRSITTYSGKAEYAVSPDSALYVAAAYNEHTYRLKPPAALLNRDSHGETFNVGANFDLTHVMRGDVQVGYLKQDFAASRLPGISGLSALGRIEWFPTQLTTVTLTGSRAIQDAAVIGTAAYVAEVASLQVDHELLRNLILTGRVGTEADTYKGVDRKDNQTTGYIGARYLLNRLVGVNVGYTYLDQRSSGLQSGPKYTVNRFVISTTLQF